MSNGAPLRPPDPERYIEGALVRGSSAWLLSRIVASPGVTTVLNNPPGWVDRTELAATIAAIHKAARGFDTASAAPERDTATALGAVMPESDLLGWTVRRAADFLGLSDRRVQEMAPELGGRRVGRQWLLDEVAVHHEGERRRHRAA
jgi:hypothetical protein